MRHYRLIVEGEGDKEAVPVYLKRLAGHLGLPIYPNRSSIVSGGLSRLRTIGGVERFVRYAEADTSSNGTIIFVDTDEECPLEVREELKARLDTLGLQKPLGLILQKTEFETLILHSLPSIPREVGEFVFDSEQIESLSDIENIRGAKERLNKIMKNRSYKETRDQVELAKLIDIDTVLSRCRSAGKALSTLRTLYGCSDPRII